MEIGIQRPVAETIEGRLVGVRRMAVLDEQGYHINTILVDERAADHYLPGYGAKLVDLGPAVNCGPAPDRLVNFKEEFVGLDGKPIVLEHGDKLDLQTLEIIKKPIEVIEDPKGKP
jgi:hypothetical protein